MGPKSRRIKKLPISLFTPDTNVNSSAAQGLSSSDSLVISSRSLSQHGRVRSANRPLVSRKITQSTITHFHTLLKKQSSLKQSLASTSQKQRNDERLQAIQTELDSVEREMTALGGLNAYQIASTLGQSKERGGDSSKVLVRWLDELGIKQEMVAQSSKLRMLEIGALMPDNYASCSKWIENHPIDLHSQHPDILEQDFLQRPLPAREQDAFDVVSCSLVLNFVSSPADRGKMLSLIHKQLKDIPNSFLFLVLPLPCLANSRYLSLSTFQDLMRIIGFTLEKEQWKPGGKVGYWLWRRSAGELEGRDRWMRKTVVEDGPKKNNFAVVLP